MDFSDFAEFIGPLIFALIAWLSNYFNKNAIYTVKDNSKAYA